MKAIAVMFLVFAIPVFTVVGLDVARRMFRSRQTEMTQCLKCGEYRGSLLTPQLYECDECGEVQDA